MDKLSADASLTGQTGDGLASGKSLHTEGHALARPECFGGAVVGDGLLQSADDGNRMAHVCFLRERLAMYEPPVWGKQTFQKRPAGAISGLHLLPGFEPGLKTMSGFFHNGPVEPLPGRLAG